MHAATREVGRLYFYSVGPGQEDGWKQLSESHAQELAGSFSDVLISYGYLQNLLIPASHYSYRDAGRMLRLVHGSEPWMMTSAVDHLPEWQLYNVYEVPRQVHAWMNRRFHSGKYWHQHTLQLQGLGESEPEGLIQVDFKTSQFSVLVSASRTLHLAQTFAYSQPLDVVYYLLAACRRFGLDQQKVSLVLTGLIELQSALYHELHQYFVHIRFREIPPSVVLPDTAGTLPRHYFTSLLNLSACAS